MKASLIIIIILIILISSAVNAREIHVAKNGNDGNSGSQALPLLTISKAVELAEAGDVITVHAGSRYQMINRV